MPLPARLGSFPGNLESPRPAQPLRPGWRLLLAFVCPAIPVVCLAGQQPESGEISSTVIEGQVFNHFGAGVQGVVVTATRPPEGTERPPTLATATTNQTGDFRLVIPQRLAGMLMVTMTAPGYAAVTREVQIDPTDEFPPFVDVELAGAGVLAGTVRDAWTAKPVAGAAVVVDTGLKQLSAETDEKGTFEIAGLLPGRVNIVTEAPGYGREQCPAQIEQGPSGKTEIDLPEAPTAEDGGAVSMDGTGRLVVNLKPEHIVHLRVTDDRGKPISGVLVECLDEDRQDFRTLASDAGGRLTIRGLHFDTRSLALRLAHEQHVSSEEFDRSIELPADSIESIHTLTMDPAGIIAGTITDRSGRRPLNGARVVVGGHGHERMPRDWSDLEGGFRITGVPPGKQVVTVHLADYAPALAEVQVAAGQTTDLTLKLEPASQVGGVVVDGDGRPVPGVHVMAVKWRGYETLGLQAMTGADGRFVIPNAPADEFLITLRHPDYEPLEDQPIRPPTADHRFVLTATAGPGSMPGVKVKVGDPAPAFELVTLDGQTIKLADLKGKTILLDFWATWCVPCIAEVPNLKKVHESFAKRPDFAMIGISLDQGDRTPKKFVQDRQIGWPQAVGGKGGAEQAANAYGVFAIPATFLIGPEGKIRAIDLFGPNLKTEVAKVLGAADRTQIEKQRSRG